MTIQGIIVGFADAQNTAHHLVLCGRSSAYQITINGENLVQIDGNTEDSLTMAMDTFAGVAGRRVQEHWKSVSLFETPNIGASKVTRLGETTFGQWLRERETHIAVVGRCWGEDDDCPMLFNNTTIEQAKEEFRLELGQVDDIKDLPEDGPGSVIITSVLLSFSPIFDVEA